jgi:endoglycosylceramidase
VGFGDDDAAFLAGIGFNVVRVGVIWKALEPRPGVYDGAYLDSIAATVRTLARHGIVSLLDVHQDMFNERFQGEGAPDWAVQDGGLPNPRFGFPNNYIGNPALEHALDAFWNNAPGPGGVGLQDRFAAAWVHIARRFRATPSVLGYELFNEPFPGTAWEQCVVPTGCAGFDARLTAFNRRIDRAIRAVDRRTLVFYEPNVLFNNGIRTRLGPLGDPRAVFAFHDYCPTEPETGSPKGCGTFDDRVFTNALARSTQTSDGMLNTEFGATNDVAYLDEVVARADRFMTGWTEWAYCGCEDPTTSGPGAKQAIVIDPRQPPRGANLVVGTLGALVEPFPQVVAGTPGGWQYSRAVRRFTLRYTTARAGRRGRFPTGSVTVIAAPRRVYGGRYGVVASGGAILSRPGAARVEIGACPGARTITVTLTPRGRSHGSCRLPRTRRR